MGIVLIFFFFRSMMGEISFIPNADTLPSHLWRGPYIAPTRDATYYSLIARRTVVEIAQRVSPAHVLIARWACFILRLWRLYSTSWCVNPVTDPSASSRHRQNFHCKLVRSRSSEQSRSKSGLLARLMGRFCLALVSPFSSVASPTAFRVRSSTYNPAAVHPN